MAASPYQGRYTAGGLTLYHCAACSLWEAPLLQGVLECRHPRLAASLQDQLVRDAEESVIETREAVFVCRRGSRRVGRRLFRLMLPLG